MDIEGLYNQLVVARDSIEAALSLADVGSDLRAAFTDTPETRASFEAAAEHLRASWTFFAQVVQVIDEAEEEHAREHHQH